MSDGLALAIVIASIVLNAFFAGVETGFTSARRVRLIHWARQGRRGATIAARLARRRENAIVGAVVGNNVAVVAGTAVATALAVRTFGDRGETIAAIVMAGLNIVFGEILPKTAYRARPEPMLVWSAPVFLVLTTLLAPLRIAAVRSARVVLWLVGERGDVAEATYTRERLLQVFTLSRTSAGIDAQQDQLLRGFIDHSHRAVETVATPMERVTTVAFAATARDALDRVRETGHSRLPVLGADGRVVGLILFRDLHPAESYTPLGPRVRDVVRIPPWMGLDEAIGVLTDRQVSLAVVEAADGQALGIVTLEDLLEPLVGDILDEHDVPRSSTHGRV